MEKKCPQRKLTLPEKKEAFKIRTRMTDVKTNMKYTQLTVICVACEIKNKQNEETQEQMH